MGVLRESLGQYHAAYTRTRRPSRPTRTTARRGTTCRRYWNGSASTIHNKAINPAAGCDPVGVSARRRRGFDLNPLPCHERRSLMALVTLALGMAMFALFFGMVAACDRL